MKKKINNKLTFVTAILNLVASLMCAGTLIWGRISIEAGYFFFDKLEGFDALGAAIVFVVLLIILVPMSILHFTAFLSVLKTSYYDRKDLPTTNIFTLKGRLIGYLLPLIGYFGIAAYFTSLLFQEANIGTIIFPAISLMMIALLLILPIIDIKKAKKELSNSPQVEKDVTNEESEEVNEEAEETEVSCNEEE